MCHTATGEIKAFCVYSAPSADVFSAAMAQVSHRIYEILEEEHAQIRDRT